MARLYSTAILVVTLSLTVTSQPFPPQQDLNKHTDFVWNSRKIGNKKVASLTIRKDEERDRRSISPVDGEDNRHEGKRHHHRHHHGETSRTALWLANDQSPAEYRGGPEPPDMYEETKPEYIERDLEDRDRLRNNDVRPASELREDHMPRLTDVLEERGIAFDRSLYRSKPSAQKRRDHSEEGRKRNGNKRKKNKNGKRNKNKKLKKKKNKGCRRLRGESRRNCLSALRQCRGLKKRQRKRCRAAALEAVFSEAPGGRKVPDVFSFLRNMTEMSGKEACHYDYLKQCCTKVGLFDEGSDSNMPVVKCHFRKEFLKCMQDMQQGGTCDIAFHTTGDMTALRKRIKEFMWTPSSCLISDVVEGN